MKYLKYTVITLLALVCTTIARGEIDDTENSENPIKLTIFGHTGQDPVYKSIIGKPGFTKPKKKTAFPRKFVDLEDMFSMDNVLQNTTDWLHVYSPVDNMNITAWNQSLPQYSNHLYSNQLHDSQVFGTSATGNSSLPAPPAFLLLLAGLTVKKRRNS
jgi:hypothetical protein